MEKNVDCSLNELNGSLTWQNVEVIVTQSEIYWQGSQLEEWLFYEGKSSFLLIKETSETS